MRPQVLITKTQTAATWSTADGTKSQPIPACGERLCQGSTTARSSNPRFKAPYVNHPKLSLRCGWSLENGGNIQYATPKIHSMSQPTRARCQWQVCNKEK